MLLTGDVPTMEQTLEVVEDWKKRSQIPQYVIDVLRALPRDTHPMTMFSAGHPGHAARLGLRSQLRRRQVQQDDLLGRDVRRLPTT